MNEIPATKQSVAIISEYFEKSKSFSNDLLSL